MYKFIKLKNDNTWYLLAQDEQTVLDHFNKFGLMEFKAGLTDRINSTHIKQDPKDPSKPWVYLEHPTTIWRGAVESIQLTKGGSYMSVANDLENKTLQNRLNSVCKGQALALSNGLPYMPILDMNDIEVTKESEELEYPREAQYHLEEVRYIKWNQFGMKGVHWYAKIGNTDIVDKDGNQKWNTKEEAEAAAKWFIEKYQWKNYFSTEGRKKKFA